MTSAVLPLAHPMRRAPFEHLTRTEREIIRRMLPRNSINEIARALGKHRCTVFRELKRNRNKVGIYYEIQAHNLMLARRRAAKEKYRIIDGHFEVGRHIQELLHKRLSPEQIAGIMRRTQYHRPVCHKTIYRWVHREWQQRKRLLRFKGKPRVPYGARKNSWEPNKRHISERPFIVSCRRRTGDWEADLVHGTQDDSASCLLTLNDRASGYCVIKALKSRNSENVRREIVLALRGFPVHTITCDNGSEFAKHQSIEKSLGCRVYFTDPNSPQQRGSNENLNGLVREFFPKGKSMINVSQQHATEAQNLLNIRPRKRLGYLTPRHVFAAMTRLNEYSSLTKSY